ncbi:hypothetical protein B5M43_013710 [Microbacterium sp. MEC084]|uniref:hypothetical protein n=1 Tax=Microbacterium sp. MEC084 TaxID=1963027 RepID=UPI00106FBB74|nr:hypothetical protein [Microbacterium sp. MEC084]MCD1269878.1 hypothetical protein [Microbacterium sp. MEC084]
MNSRILNVVRLQFVNKQTFLWVPLIILAGTVLLNVMIVALVPGDGPTYSGGAQAPLWYFLYVGISSLTLTFPFSQAMSLTRREFYLGTVVAAALTGGMLATLFVLLGLVERATGGYGVNAYLSYLPAVWAPGWWAAWIVMFITTMFFFVIGFWGATIFKRWGATVLTIVLFSLGLVAIGGLYVVGRLSAWDTVFQWFATAGSLGVALWAIPVILLLGGGSYLTLRRATV